MDRITGLTGLGFLEREGFRDGIGFHPVNPVILSEFFAFAARRDKNLGQDYRINRIRIS
ncbi:MAG: hypothetical protein ACP5SH_03230 [Syntrophobacteraceae bacterium]